MRVIKKSVKKPEDFEEMKKFILHHCELNVDALGNKKGMLDIRKHLAMYIKGFEGASKLRSELVRVESVDEVKRILMSVSGN